MSVKKGTRNMLWILYVLSWIIFVGLSIRAAGFLVGAIFTLVKPEFVKNLWMWQEVDLSALFHYNQNYFFMLTLIMSIAALAKAILFYLIISILHDKRSNLAQPFNQRLGRFVFILSYLSVVIGLFSAWGFKYTESLVHEGVKMPDAQYLNLGGADVWLFMGIVFFIIGQIFKRGIELQEDNELTV